MASRADAATVAFQLFPMRAMLVCRRLLWRRPRAVAVVVSFALVIGLMIMMSSGPKSALLYKKIRSPGERVQSDPRRNEATGRVVHRGDYIIPDHCPPLFPSPLPSASADVIELDSALLTRSEVELEVQDAFKRGEEEFPGRRFGVTLQPVDLCWFKSPSLLVIVPSAPTHGGVRHLIRTTWGSVRKAGNDEVRTIFLLGKSRYSAVNEALLQESRQHGDLLQMDFIDAYQNLTLKVLSGLSWVVTHCGGVRFVLKADDDTFVHLEALLRKLRPTAHSERALWGRFYLHDSGVVRAGKWGVSPQLYPLHSYPPYASGIAYALTGVLAACMVEQWRHAADFPIEDVYMTSILAPRCQATRYHVTSMSAWGHELPEACDLAQGNKMVANHVTPRLAEEFWRLVLEVQKTSQPPASQAVAAEAARNTRENVTKDDLPERDAYVDGVLRALQASADVT